MILMPLSLILIVISISILFIFLNFLVLNESLHKEICSMLLSLWHLFFSSTTPSEELKKDPLHNLYLNDEKYSAVKSKYLTSNSEVLYPMSSGTTLPRVDRRLHMQLGFPEQRRKMLYNVYSLAIFLVLEILLRLLENSINLPYEYV